MRVLLTDGASIFAAVLSVCSIFVGIGIMVQLVPIISGGISGIIQNKERIIIAFILCAFMIGGGKGLQAIGIGNFALATGVKGAIERILTETAGMERIAADKDTTDQAREQARSILDTCIKMPQTLANGEANPAFDECKGRVAAAINEGKLAKEGAEIGPGNPIEDMAKTIGSVFSGMGDAIMALPRVIFEAMKVAVGLAEMLAYGLAMVMLPVAASWSLIDTSLLKKWFSGFWGVAFYGWAVTILSGSFEIINAKIGGSVPMFTAEIILAIVVPFIAAMLAGQGAEGVYLSLSRLGEMTARVATSGVKKG